MNLEERTNRQNRRLTTAMQKLLAYRADLGVLIVEMERNPFIGAPSQQVNRLKQALGEVEDRIQILQVKANQIHRGESPGTQGR